MKQLLFIFLFATTVLYGQDTKLSVKVEGRVKNPKTFSFDEIKAMPMFYVDSVQVYNHEMVPRSMVRNIKGVLLKELLKSIEFDAATPRELSEYYIVCVAKDNYKAVFSWNEIFNNPTGDKAMVATERDGVSSAAHKDGLISFGQLSEITGKNFQAEVKDTDELKVLLQDKYRIPSDIKYLIAVNKKVTGSNTSLKAEDAVALLPPYSGG
jgi:molybdopterin converting factor small subunit